MRWMAYLFVVVSLVGCAESRYAQEGKKAMEAEQDTFQCEDKILAEHQGLRNMSATEKQQLMDDCMRAKGYRLAQ